MAAVYDGGMNVPVPADATQLPLDIRSLLQVMMHVMQGMQQQEQKFINAGG